MFFQIKQKNIIQFIYFKTALARRSPLDKSDFLPVKKNLCNRVPYSIFMVLTGCISSDMEKYGDSEVHITATGHKIQKHSKFHNDNSTNN